MSRKDYLDSLSSAVDALERHLENTKVFAGSPLEKTAKYQELMVAKNQAYNLMLEERDVLFREDLRVNKKPILMTPEEEAAYNSWWKNYTLQRKRNEQKT